MNLAGGSGSSTAQHMEQTNPDTLFFSFYRNGTDFCELTTCEGDDAEVHSGSYNVEHRVTGAYRISGDTIILDAVLSGDHMHGLSFLVRANRVLFVPNSANFFALEPSMLIQVNRLTGMNLNKLNSKKSDNQIK